MYIQDETKTISYTYTDRCRRDHGRMVVGLTNTYISAYHH